MAASGLANILLQKSQGFSFRRPPKNRWSLAIFGVSPKIAGSSQWPWPQVTAAARFRGRNDQGTLRKRRTRKQGIVARKETDKNIKTKVKEGQDCLLSREILWIFSSYLRAWRFGNQMISMAMPADCRRSNKNVWNCGWIIWKSAGELPFETLGLVPLPMHVQYLQKWTPSEISDVVIAEVVCKRRWDRRNKSDK